ncbi:MAG TPA: VWA domain-containing protein [Deltaproteobacteria bacterium]|nr:VWA domain-containing protein [Deltaproteobacteria bacterium]
MLNSILKFVSCCRAAGYRISTSEVLDCFAQLELIDILDEEAFRTVLRSNFAKSRRDQSQFDHLYHLYFHELRGDLAGAEELGKMADKVMEVLREEVNGDRSHRAIIDFLSGDPFSFLDMLRQIRAEQDSTNLGKGFNLGPLASRLQVMVTLNRVRGRIEALLREDPHHFGLTIRAELDRYFNNSLGSAYSLLLREPRPHTDDRDGFRAHEKHLAELGERPFSSLSPREVEEVREVIDRLVRKLKDIISRRYAANRRGVLDVKKTLRRADRYHGVPVEIIFRKHPPKKARIVTLCDISSSVWSAARFMLSILYSLQECFDKVKSFVFVSGLAEVTEIFENEEINRAVEKVLRELDLNYQAPTDYGETFRQFRHDYLDTLTKRTTLIIMGDARTNYLHPEDRILEEMRERCKRVIWLNPEPVNLWNTGDSEMNAYKPSCNELRQCRNLNQLVEFIEELVL